MTTHAVSAPTSSPDRAGRRPFLLRLLLGRRTDAVWARPALWALLIVTAVLYLVGLSDSGWANSFYAAAVQAGSQNWEAWFFGSLDPSNAITVDKPPASLWVMGLSARVFGFSSWSLLVPQALEGVAAVALVYASVSRVLAHYGRTLATVGGLVAGFALAFTPAAALMFRFDNPDALLVLLMTAAGYCVIRALPKASAKWLALAGVALGFAFLTKMLQGFLVLPAFALVYLLFANTKVWKRIVHLLIAGVAVVVAAGWWVLAVALWPASARPYIGGSTNNTVLDLVFGYNGLARIQGGAGNGGGGGGTAGGSFGGSTGIARLFSSEMGLEISWLIPAALIALVLGLIVARGRVARAGLVLFGGWLLVTGIVFSFMSGTIHPYYTVALAPAIGGLLGIGGVALWKVRDRWIGRIGLAAMVLVSSAWGFQLLGETPDWLPWLRYVVLIGGLLASVLFVAGSVMNVKRMATVALAAGVATSFAGPVAYAVATASVAHSGSIPSVGSSSVSSGGFGGFGGMGGGGAAGGSADGGGDFGGGGAAGGSADGGGMGGGDFSGGGAPSGSAPSGTTDGSAPSEAGGAGTDSDTGTEEGSSTSDEAATSGESDSTGSTSSSDLESLLSASTARWAAATNGSQSAAEIELSTNTAVMAIGGWTSDPYPTLAQFEAYVADGDISYYISGGQGGGGGQGGDSTASAIATWVDANFSSTTVGGYTVYDLSSPTS